MTVIVALTTGLIAACAAGLSWLAQQRWRNKHQALPRGSAWTRPDACNAKGRMEHSAPLNHESSINSFYFEKGRKCPSQPIPAFI